MMAVNPPREASWSFVLGAHGGSSLIGCFERRGNSIINYGLNIHHNNLSLSKPCTATAESHWPPVERRLNHSHNDTGLNNQLPCDWAGNGKTFADKVAISSRRMFVEKELEINMRYSGRKQVIAWQSAANGATLRGFGLSDWRFNFYLFRFVH